MANSVRRMIVAHHILVVDDDPHIREIIGFALEKAGMKALMAINGAEALSRFAQKAPDLIVLDIGMPETDGLEVCRQIRKVSDVPILFLSARDEEIDRVLGLEIGGDDYVTKPFSPRELVARVNAILKRARLGASTEECAAKRLSHGALTMDVAAHLAVFDGEPLPLTAIEFAIVRTLLARPRQVFSREQILDAAYGGAVYVADRTIDSHVRNIRAKFNALGCASAIETLHGVGFRLGACEVSA
jgi:two-component system OmpR family response regulator